MANLLESLAAHTVIVADTGDFEAIARFNPEDATTNPSLIYKAVQSPQYRPLISEALDWAMKKVGDSADFLDYAIDRLSVLIGAEILKVVPGKVSTEVDARLSFDTAKTVERVRRLVTYYQEVGISKQRVLIKIASTWEGIRACEILEKEGIHCNMTLIFGFGQAVACAEAGAYLISPFVGRIYDWHKNKEGRDFAPAEDPGVQSVKGIYQYYKKFGYETIIMGASFRNIGQIQELTGCDRLTISPALMEELKGQEGTLKPRLYPDMPIPEEMNQLLLSEKTYRWMLNEDAMAVEKLAEGIRLFSKDLVKLESYLRDFKG